MSIRLWHCRLCNNSDNNTTQEMFGLEWRDSHQCNLSNFLFERKERTNWFLSAEQWRKCKDTQAKICQPFFPVTVENSLGFLVQCFKKTKSMMDKKWNLMYPGQKRNKPGSFLWSRGFWWSNSGIKVQQSVCLILLSLYDQALLLHLNY